MKQRIIEKGHQPFIVFETPHLDEEGCEDTDTHELPATGAGGGGHFWAAPEKVRLLHSTATQRKLAVDDFSSILRRIAAIK